MDIRFLLFGLLLGVIGCGARGEVAKDQVLAQVDRLLGEIDVKRKGAEIAVRNTEAGLDRLKKGKIEAKVRLTQTSDRLSELGAKTERADQALIRLRDLLQSGQDAEINGNTYTVVALKDMADRTISARKKLANEAEVLESSRQRLERTVAALDGREQDGRERLRKLKQHLDEIDTKAVALKSMQDAASISGTTETLDFEVVEKQVRDLSTKLDVELAYQDEKWHESVSDEKSLDTLFRETSTASDTVSEIDVLLGS